MSEIIVGIFFIGNMFPGHVLLEILYWAKYVTVRNISHEDAEKLIILHTVILLYNLLYITAYWCHINNLQWTLRNALDQIDHFQVRQQKCGHSQVKHLGASSCVIGGVKICILDVKYDESLIKGNLAPKIFEMVETWDSTEITLLTFL